MNIKPFGGKKKRVGSKKSSPTSRVMTDLLDPNDDAVQSWRVFRIMSEFVAGFEILRRYGLAATFFGSARCNAGDDVYRQSEELAGRLAKSGFAIITGGGGGVMEASNIGAYKANGHSVGFNIDLPAEQRLNSYTTESENFNFFFSRKVMLAFASEVYVYFPGGFGTLDEFFEITTLVQTKKIKRIPIVLIGKDYWEPLLAFIEKTLYEKYGAIDESDMELYHLVDSVDEAYDYIMKTVDTKNTYQV